MSLDTTTYQTGWRQCSLCFSLFFADAKDRAGRCIGNVEHISTTNKFKVAFAGYTMKGQENWRWCSKCSALFFNGHWKKGVCPADSGWHSSQGSGNYELLHSTDQKHENLYGWRWCRQCEQLFFCPFGQCLTYCPAGGSHSNKGSGFYFVQWIS